MKLSLTFGKHVGQGRLSAEQQSVLERLERDEITPEEATKLLGGNLRLFDFSVGSRRTSRRPSWRGPLGRR